MKHFTATLHNITEISYFGLVASVANGVSHVIVSDRGNHIHLQLPNSACSAPPVIGDMVRVNISLPSPLVE